MWPQYVVVGWVLITVGIRFALCDQRTKSVSGASAFWSSAISLSALMWLLWEGGFFVGLGWGK